MSSAKIAVSIDRRLLDRLDRMVAARQFPSRSRAVQDALLDHIRRADRSRLAKECAKLDPDIEQQLAEEGIKGDLAECPEY